MITFNIMAIIMTYIQEVVYTGGLKLEMLTGLHT